MRKLLVSAGICTALFATPAFADNTIKFSKSACEPMALLVVDVHDHVLAGKPLSEYSKWPPTNIPELKRFYLVIGRVSEQNRDLTSIELGEAFYQACLRGTNFTLYPEV